MPETKNDGGPAFPRPASEGTINGTLPEGNDAVAEQEGMTLRDYFAAAALTGIIAADAAPTMNPESIAYGMADRMLAVRDE